MEIELGMDKKIYTPVELFALNTKYEECDPIIMKYFQSFPKNLSALDYPNKLNPNFKDAGKKKTLGNKKDLYSVDKIIEDINPLINSVTKNLDKNNDIIKKLKGMKILKSQVEIVSSQFYEAMIETEFLIEEYIYILIQLAKQTITYSTIYEKIIMKAIIAFKSDKTYEDTERESGIDKKRRLTTNNNMIICSLYNINGLNHKFLKTELICDRFIDKVFANEDMEQIRNIWSMLWTSDKRLYKEDIDKYNKYQSMINSFSEDIKFSRSDRAKLLKFTDDSDSD